MATVEDLIAVLQEIESDPEIEAVDVLNRGNIEDKHELIREATLLAQEVLLLSIEAGGRNHEAEYALLRDGGFQIWPVANEGCAWVMGAIETSKGLLGYA